MVEVNSILYPFDLSQPTDEALLYSVALALSNDSKLYLCNCVDSLGGLLAAEKDRINELFKEKIERCFRFGNTKKIDWEGLILEGDPAEAISRAAAERRVDLVVMRSRRRPLAATMLGSTAEATCRLAPCSVMVTHESERDWVGPNPTRVDLKRLLVAYDFSDDSEMALRYALWFARNHGAELHILHALTPLSARHRSYDAVAPLSAQTEYRESMRRLEIAMPRATLRNGNVKLSVSEGYPYREVLSYAEEHSIDLICMGVHGAGHGINSLFGSNVDRVLRQAPCPVLIARPLRPFVGEIPKSNYC